MCFRTGNLLEGACMLLSRKSWITAAITIIMVVLISQLSELSFVYCVSKPHTATVNESGTIVISDASDGSAPSLDRGSDALEGICEKGLCKEFYPKDGKIEGQSVTLLNAAGINSGGQMAGLCVLGTPAKNYPFVREPDGHFWIFKTPSSTGQGEFTDISDNGSAVGAYHTDSSNTTVGFLMNSQRKWVMDIKYPSNPCPSTRSYLHTQPNGINDNGEIVGNYDCTERPDEAADALSKGNGFYRAPDGTYYRVQYENASRTVAGKINNLGIIYGYYVIDRDTWMPFTAKKEDLLKPILP
jgi:hypothetical protein